MFVVISQALDELMAVLSGEMCVAADKVRFGGQPIGAKGPNERRALGILAAPEERLGHAAAPDMSLTENAVLSAWVRMGLVNRGLINWRDARAYAERVVEEFDVRTPGVANAARALSGGNLQKFVVGREIMQSPDILIINQPT